MVAQLCKDFDGDYTEVNKQLDKMGYNIGLRLIEDFMAKANTGRCANFRETGEAIAKVICDQQLACIESTDTIKIGFKVFLNVTPTVTNFSADGNQFSLIFDENPLAEFVELPDDDRAMDELWYSNVFCGILRGALEMVSVIVLHTYTLGLTIATTDSNTD